MTRTDHNSGSYVPYFLREVWGCLKSPLLTTTEKKHKFWEDPRRLESLNICRCLSKDSSFSLVIFKTLSVGSVWVLKPRPLARQSGALQRELAKMTKTPNALKYFIPRQSHVYSQLIWFNFFELHKWCTHQFSGNSNAPVAKFLELQIY